MSALFIFWCTDFNLAILEIKIWMVCFAMTSMTYFLFIRCSFYSFFFSSRKRRRPFQLISSSMFCPFQGLNHVCLVTPRWADIYSISSLITKVVWLIFFFTWQFSSYCYWFDAAKIMITIDFVGSQWDRIFIQVHTCISLVVEINSDHHIDWQCFQIIECCHVT